jgi:hypothetical protein
LNKKILTDIKKLKTERKNFLEKALIYLCNQKNILREYPRELIKIERIF